MEALDTIAKHRFIGSLNSQPASKTQRIIMVAREEQGSSKRTVKIF